MCLNNNLIKSIHVLSGLPVQVYDKNFNISHFYVSNRAALLSYDFNYERISKLNSKFAFLSGNFNELFIFCYTENNTLVFGPLLTNHLEQKDIDSLIKNKSSNSEQYEKYHQYISLMPVFSLGDIRDFLYLFNYIFYGESNDCFSSQLHEEVNNDTVKIQEKLNEQFRSRFFDPNKYSFYYENQILELVQKGDLKNLKEELGKLSNSVVPNLTGDTLRSEKNYTIVILEKLSSLAIQFGADVSETFSLRDYYIRKMEEKNTLVDVLFVRDCAIIQFAKYMRDVGKNTYSTFIRSVTQYISLNIYQVIRVKDIADKFYVSETSLRQKFKNETHKSISEYINLRKVNESKLLLKSGYTPLEVTNMLNYYDYSHFYKTFKHYTGVSPKTYQNKRVEKQLHRGI